ncbi:hypothetical protein ABRP58_06515 [Pectobacterium aroidearum]|uniref:phage tail fiber protein n=1 Tax=Pectobacterium aroidearum TaxID=1201031 RepID=UPI0032EEF1CB
MSGHVTANDLPPIKELDEFTSHIPELQTDTSVLAGTGGPANYQASALANRTKYLKRALDSVSQELIEIDQSLAAAQQSADEAKQGADASMKIAANGSDIVNPAAFRSSIGLSNAMLRGDLGWGNKAKNIGSNVNLFDYFTRDRPADVYWVNQTGINRPPDFVDCVLLWNPIEHDDFYGCLLAISFTTGGAKTAMIGVANGVWETSWNIGWDTRNLSPVTANTNQVIHALKTYMSNWASLILMPEALGQPSYLQGNNFDGSTRWTLGYQDINTDHLTLRNNKAGVAMTMHADRNIYASCNDFVLTDAKGFVKNSGAGAALGDITAVLNYYASEQSMGSTKDETGNVWRTHISARHRGGNGNQEPTADSQKFGFAIVDDNMTSAYYQINVIKQVAGAWQQAVGLYHTGNTTADANGFLKVASPVVKLFGAGTSELNIESEGVVTTRIDQGVYRISGCLGLNADLAWGGLEGGIVGPRCRNGLERLWVDYDVEQDGSIVIRTYHRTHPNAMLFARNERDGYAEGDPIDIPADTFLSIRVQMPARETTYYVPLVTPSVRHSNVYCNTLSPTK